MCGRIMHSEGMNPERSDSAGEPCMTVRPRSRRLTLLLRLTYIIYLALVCEIGARAYWCYRGVPFLHMSAIWYTFYPEMKTSGVESAVVRNNDAVFDVLLLGGSALHEDYGSIGRRLGEGLQTQLGRPVKVHNLALAGKTSRDSLIKYRTLHEQRFDLVVFYHGINDTRMNNCPRELYRDDYTHCSWYKKLDMFDRHQEKTLFVLPYSVAYLVVGALDQMRLGWYIPRFEPAPAWLEHGKDVKTEAAFHSNLTEIINESRSKGERFLLMTYTYYVPANYNLERFRAGQLDYTQHKSPIEIWGKPANVTHGIDVHNAVIRRVAAADPRILFVDQQQLMPPGARHYCDCCHLTEEGCAIFVRHILDTVKGKL